jgi:hypothetical protein
MSDVAWILIVAAVFGIAAAPGLLALGLYVRNLARRVDGLESLRLLDAAERGKLQCRVDELEHGVNLLIAQIRRLGATPEWMPAPTTAAPAPPGGQLAETNRLVDLWQRIESQFSTDEMRDLLFELRLSDFTAETPGALARGVVTAAQRHHRLDELRAIARRERPEGGF